MFLLLVALIGMLYFGLKALEAWGPRPTKFALGVPISFLFSWILFLSGFYSWVSVPTGGDMMWNIGWISCIAYGVMAFFYEKKHNFNFSWFLLFLSLFHLNFYLFSLSFS